MTKTLTTDDQTPVTVVTGPLGAGKTTLVNRLLERPEGRHIAVIVNDMGEVNVDAESLESESDDVVDLSNGCICCQLGDDLVEQLTRLLDERQFDQIVVEASGISEPLPIARTLTAEARDGDAEAAPPYRLDTVVSVVDAYGFWKAFDPDETLPAAASETGRPLADVMVDQVEFCDLVLLNKCDMVPDDALNAVEEAVRELQPRAAVRRTTHADVEPDAVLDTGRFDFEAAQQAPGWRQALADGHDHGHSHDEESAADRHGVESIVYERTQPFHPARLDAWLDDWDGSIIRAKGFLWVAGWPDEVIGMSQAGPSVQVGPIGKWGDEEPKTRLVLIGRDLDEERLREELTGCLMAEAEPVPSANPFPREQ